MRRAVLLIPLLLSAVSLLELASINPQLALKQGVILAVSVGSALLIARVIPFNRIYQNVYVIAVVTLIPLFVLATHLGGSSRWFSVGGTAFQPSEFAKLALILVLAHIFEEEPDSTRNTLAASAAAVVPFALVFLQPDLATASAFFFVYGGMVFLMRGNLKFLLTAFSLPIAAVASFSTWAFVAVFGATVAVIRYLRTSMGYALALLSLVLAVGLATPYLWAHALKGYQRARITAFLKPERHARGVAWQVKQAQIAIGSGGLFGKGFKGGTQKGFEFLPEAHTDFIFAAVAEEFGAVTSVLLVAAMWLLVFSIFRTASTLKMPFSRGVGYGVGLMLSFHIMANLLSVVGLLPVAGIPLPFVSQGGSHLLAEYAGIGLVMGVRRHEAPRSREA